MLIIGLARSNNRPCTDLLIRIYILFVDVNKRPTLLLLTVSLQCDRPWRVAIYVTRRQNIIDVRGV